MSADPIVIVSAARTPMGAFQGELKDVSATALGSAAIRAAMERAGLSDEDVSEVMMGCVLPAGLGQAPARQAALGAGLPDRVPCATLNKVCGSGMKTIMLGHDVIAAGSADVVVAGGMGSMSNAPYLLDKARSGQRLGHGRMIGASGARIVVTLLAALKERGLRKGVASLCIGGGEATALAVELVH